MFFLALITVIFGLLRYDHKITGKFPEAFGVDISNMSFSLNNLTIVPQIAKRFSFYASTCIMVGHFGLAGINIQNIRQG